MILTFNQPPSSDDDFIAMRAAERWLSENGYSVGSSQRGSPRGIKRGQWLIAKWRGLSIADRSDLDGVMTGGRGGPVTIEIYGGK